MSLPWMFDNFLAGYFSFVCFTSIKSSLQTQGTERMFHGLKDDYHVYDRTLKSQYKLLGFADLYIYVCAAFLSANNLWNVRKVRN